jgi:hypothetical protein
MPDAEGNPLNEAEARETIRRVGMELWKAAANYVVAIFWMRKEGARASILHSGSGFFMRVERPTILVTAAHVIRQYEADARQHGASVKAQVMNIEFVPTNHLLDIDDSLDIATIKVPDNLPERVGKWCYRRQADRWPPPPPVQERAVFLVAFLRFTARS